MNVRKLLRFSWIAPLVFFTVILLGGLFYPGYSHIRQHVSELAVPDSPVGFLVTWFGLIPFGLMIMAHAVGGILSYRGDILGILSFIAIFLTGVSFITVGIYPCDETCGLPDMSRQARLHANAAAATFVCIWISQLLTGIKTFTGRRSAFTFFAILMFIAGWLVNKAAAESWLGPENKGLIQRVYFVYVAVWLIASGIAARTRLRQRGE
ncbi:MAG: DUF998 domain-containing protein [Saprospiraceae bacterium]|nr:DUF998 domain-containing protein [Saprospiraceae bacterium]